MPTAPAPPLSDWHDFFMLLGTASATLIGAMFVVVSLGIGILTRDKELATGAFLTSTVTHLSIVLLGAALTMTPGLDWRWFGAIAGLAGIAGLAYSIHVVSGFRQHDGTDFSDWFWYAGFPLVAYATLAAAGATGLRGMALSLDLLAAALSLLLVAGIRNAWDMILFLVARDRGST